ELKKIKTTGDKILDVPLAKVGGKGLFVKEIEDALLSHKVDLAVHSMKDVPTDLPEGLHIASVTEREDPRDALLARGGCKMMELPHHAKIGTSSLRRQAQILSVRSDFEINQLRGNLDTRIKKLETKELDAVILAAAGIRRMGWTDKITEYISTDVCLPAIGQGAVGIETRVDDEAINSLVLRLNHETTSLAVRAERAFLKKLEGGCQVPIAAYGEINGDKVKLRGLVGRIDGSEIIKDSLEGSVERVEEIGDELAEKLLSMGAGEILKEVYDLTISP
ncbi:MAG: hydroxymethylbilane synthase, partial [Thermodesulfobacteriota bacterium]